jgi:hypothetical protein
MSRARQSKAAQAQKYDTSELSQRVKGACFPIQLYGDLMAVELFAHRQFAAGRENIGFFAPCTNAMQQPAFDCAYLVGSMLAQNETVDRNSIRVRTKAFPFA